MLTACLGPVEDAVVAPYLEPHGSLSAFDGMINETQSRHLRRTTFPQLSHAERQLLRRINAEVNRALKLADVRERLSGIAAEVLGGTPEDLSALVKTDFERYGRIARENRIRAD